VIIAAFEVGDDMCGGPDVFLQSLFNLGGYAVRVTEKNVRREIKVKFDKVGVTDVAVPQVVVRDVMAAGFSRDDTFDLAMDFGIGGIHEPADAAADEPSARHEDICRGKQCKKRVPVSPVCQLHESQSQ
jgi:hypothetical protein